jgi:hypothetical protein
LGIFTPAAPDNLARLSWAIMLILGLILFGMLIGAGAQLILGKSAKGVDWTLALVPDLPGRSSAGC